MCECGSRASSPPSSILFPSRKQRPPLSVDKLNRGKGHLSRKPSPPPYHHKVESSLEINHTALATVLCISRSYREQEKNRDLPFPSRSSRAPDSVRGVGIPSTSQDLCASQQPHRTATQSKAIVDCRRRVFPRKPPTDELSEQASKARQLHRASHCRYTLDQDQQYRLREHRISPACTCASCVVFVSNCCRGDIHLFISHTWYVNTSSTRFLVSSWRCQRCACFWELKRVVASQLTLPSHPFCRPPHVVELSGIPLVSLPSFLGPYKYRDPSIARPWNTILLTQLLTARSRFALPSRKILDSSSIPSAINRTSWRPSKRILPMPLRPKTSSLLARSPSLAATTS